MKDKRSPRGGEPVTSPLRPGMARRDVFRLAGGIGGAALVSSALAACGGGSSSTSASDEKVSAVTLTSDLVAAAKAEKTMFLRYGEPLPTMQAYSKAFTAEYGITLQLERQVGVVGNQAFATEERAGKHVMDVNMSSDPPGLDQLTNEGLYLRYSLPQLAPYLPSNARLGNYAYTYGWSQTCFQYNPNKISTADAVALFSSKDWNGLLDPSLKGNIGLTDPAGGGVPFSTYLALYRDSRYGEAYLSKLGQLKPTLYSGSAPGREAVDAGDVAVFVPDFTQIAMQDFSTGDKTRWTYTSDMMPLAPNSYLAISATAPHPNAARLWVLWLLGKLGQKEIQTQDQPPILTNVPVSLPAVTALEKTDWWKPFPSQIQVAPDMSVWISQYSTLVTKFRSLLGYTG